MVEAYQSVMAQLSRVSDVGLGDLHAQLEEALPDYESLSRDQETTDAMTFQMTRKGKVANARDVNRTYIRVLAFQQQSKVIWLQYG